MELVFDKKDISKKKIKSEHIDDLRDHFFYDYYLDYYNNISSEKLDELFRNDLKNLTKIISKSSDPERKIFIDIISRVIGFYLDKKISKEIDSYVFKIFK